MTVVRAGTEQARRGLGRAWRLVMRVFGWSLATAYGLVVRFAVAVAAVWGVLYFLVASQPFTAWVEQTIADVIPGAISCATVRWGPVPWEVSVTEGRIHGARGEDVVRVRGVRVKVDMLRTLIGVARFIDNPSDNPFPLYVDFAEVVEPWAAIRVDEAGRVGFVDALDASGTLAEPSTDDTPLMFDIHVADALVHRGSGVIETPGFSLVASGLDARTDFHVTGDAVIAFEPDKVSVDSVSAIFHTFDHLPDDLAIAAHDLDVSGLRWAGDRFAWDRVVVGLGESAAAATGRIVSHGGMDVAPDDPTWQGSARIEIASFSPVPAEITAGFVTGPMVVNIDGSGDISSVSADFVLTSNGLRVGGLDLGATLVAGRFAPRADPVDDDVHAILVDVLSTNLGGGVVRLADLAWEPAAEPVGSARDLDFSWCLDAVDVAAVLESPAFGPIAGLLFAPRVAISGCGIVGTRNSTVFQSHSTELAVDSLVATLGPGSTLPPFTGAWRLAGQFRRTIAPPSLDAGLVGTDRIDLEGVMVDRDEDRFRLAGSVDLGARRFDLEPYLRIGDVQRIADTLALGDLKGRFVLKEMRLGGTFDEPRLRGFLNWTGAWLDGRSLESVKGQLDFQGGWLALNNLRSTNQFGGVALDGRIELLADGRPSERLPFELQRLQVQRLELARFTEFLGPTARIDLAATRLSGELTRLSETIIGVGTVDIHRGVIGGESFTTAHADIRFSPGDITVRELRVELAAGPLWRGQVEVDRRRRTLRGTATIAPTSLAGLGLVQRDAPGLTGLVEANVNVSGSIEAPVFIGTVGVLDLAWDEILLGSAALNIGSSGPGLVDISTLDGAFFRSLDLRAATLELDGFVPSRLHATIGTDRLSPADFLAALRSDGFRYALTSEVSLDLDLRSGRNAFTLEAPPGGVRITAPTRNLTWENGSPLTITSDGRRMEMQPVSVRLRGREGAPLELCGAWVQGRGLDVRIGGAVDLGLIPGLDEVFSTMRGRVDVASTSGVAVAETGSCFFGDVPQVFVTGPPDALRIEGALRTTAIDLMPRGSGRGMRIEPDARIELRPGSEPGMLDVILPTTAPLEITLDDGTARVDGRLSFRAFKPTSADLHILGSDIYFQSPGEFAMTVSPDIRLEAARLDATPDVLVEGNINISEGRFYKSFDVLSEAVGDAFSGRGDVYSQSIFDAIPWLQAARLALDIKAEDFQIQTSLPLASTDLPARFDLSLRGTIARPTLFRRIDLLPNGQLRYFVFERTFRVMNGSVDFDGPVEFPVIDVTAQTPIAYLARASTDTLDEDEREVTVTLRVFGRVPDLKIELSADDATLDQADIQSLLLTGKPRGDLDRAQESRVVSADLAGVLNGLLSSPFIRTASVGVGQKGAMEYRVGTCFAPNLCFDTTTVADDTETTLRARFSLLLGDHLVCEGTLRRSDAATTTNQQTYQARCRYRIPLR